MSAGVLLAVSFETVLAHVTHNMEISNCIFCQLRRQ